MHSFYLDILGGGRAKKTFYSQNEGGGGVKRRNQRPPKVVTLNLVKPGNCEKKFLSYRGNQGPVGMERSIDLYDFSLQSTSVCGSCKKKEKNQDFKD